MKTLSICLLIAAANVSHAACSINSYGQMTDSYGGPCSQYSNEYRRDGNNLYGNTVDNSRESYNTINGGRTWNSTTPSSSLGVDTSIYAPSSGLNQNRNNGIGWNPINP